MEDDGKLAFLDLLAKIKASVTLETPADRKKNRRTKTKLSQQSLKQPQKFVHTNLMHERKKNKIHSSSPELRKQDFPWKRVSDEFHEKDRTRKLINEDSQN